MQIWSRIVAKTNNLEIAHIELMKINLKKNVDYWSIHQKLGVGLNGFCL